MNILQWLWQAFAESHQQNQEDFGRRGISLLFGASNL
jgi:hypothetical protein